MRVADSVVFSGVAICDIRYVLPVLWMTSKANNASLVDVSIPWQRVTSPHRCAQANATAASYWLCAVS